MGTAVFDPIVLDGISVIEYDESGNESTRLADVRLTLARGEWLYVVGVNGSGKSTLARILAGIYTEGLSGDNWRGFAGEGCNPIVMQHPEAQLFGETPWEELQFALEWRQTPAERIAAIAEEELRRVGLLELADERWERLSGGQRQLAAFAAAVAGGAQRMLVLDEATSMLDEASRQTIERQARRLQREGTAIVWVTQRLDELDPDSRVIVMAEGRVIYDGGVREMLFGRPGDMAASPCEQAGLRLPYASALALQLWRGGRLRDAGVLPVTAAEWSTVGFRRIAAASDSLHEHRANSSASSSSPSLRIEGLPWRVAGDAAAVTGARLELAAGTLTLMIGANGAGKTTLLEKLAGLRPPEGVLTSYGEEPVWTERRWGKRKLNDQALRRYSYVPQSAEDGLFARTLEEELRFSARPYRLGAGELDVRMEAAVGAVGWDAQWLSRDPYRMSGGERRRAALAASFVPPAPWLLLDEPTAGLDGEGHARLGNYLTSLRDSGVGVLFVSHDLDWALPLADRVLLLGVDGIVRSCTSAELLAHPEWLAEAGMTEPLWLALAHEIGRAGVSTEQVWSPQVAAQSVEVIKRAGSGIVDGGGANEESLINDINKVGAAVVAKRRLESVAGDHRLGAFDPRTIWLAYVLLSIGIFAQASWYGIAAAAALTLTVLAVGRISLWRWKALLQGYAVFSVVATGFFALGAGDGGVSFDRGAFVDTLLPFARTYIVLLLGLCIPLVMSPLSLRNALQKLLSFRGRTPALAHRLILTVTIMIRFIPVLVAEWSKFSRIELSRAKQRSGKPWRIVVRLRDLAMPLMLSIFRLGDEIAVALESRGVTMNSRPTLASKLRWAQRDYLLVAVALLLAVAMWMLARAWR